MRHLSKQHLRKPMVLQFYPDEQIEVLERKRTNDDPGTRPLRKQTRSDEETQWLQNPHYAKLERIAVKNASIWLVSPGAAWNLWTLEPLGRPQHLSNIQLFQTFSNQKSPNICQHTAPLSSSNWKSRGSWQDPEVLGQHNTKISSTQKILRLLSPVSRFMGFCSPHGQVKSGAGQLTQG